MDQTQEPSGAPSGVLFWAIAYINVNGMFWYPWMFTVLFGIGLCWLLPDSPSTASFLTEHDFYGIIIKGFGFSTYQAVLLNVPPAIIMAVTMVIVSITLSTRWGEGKRILFIILCYILGLVSTAMLFRLSFNTGTKTAHLGAIFIVLVVASSAGIMCSLPANNVAGYSTKVLAVALFFSSNRVSNIVSPQVSLAREAPYYHTGIIVGMAAFAVNIAVFALLYVLYSRENKTRDVDPAGLEGKEDLVNVNASSDFMDWQNRMLLYKL
ncbi:hypothetical protein PENARI_c022G02176 [Penicillium arizonense]|uniref:Major facilitator superfamily (MFS) profile domain-containing protein n=1 Tax=Penicillium arizonense TaxID=1835702 RepID=A0A1F5L8M9_PENAI|nr:hypothetical protein PENARI_c022G02176 [Penicillium arizonense]OGE49319.1 hypothetical protein PENARI_c022G02176 [Penicillium arizonense]